MILQHLFQIPNKIVVTKCVKGQTPDRDQKSILLDVHIATVGDQFYFLSCQG